MNFIAYFRVSTQKQGQSGLGLDAQKSAVATFAKGNNGRILASYTEIESGKRADRPELAKALTHAKRSSATLVVAKLDRLARNVEFLAKVMNSGADFVAVDNPAANRFILHVLAAVAENEAKATSDRTKAALTAAKARGKKLGSAREGHWVGKEERRLEGARTGNLRSSIVRAKLAAQARNELAPIILGLREEGLTLDQIAAKLNAEGWKTRQCKEWNGVYVCRFLKLLTQKREQC